MMHAYQVFDDKTVPVATIGFETPLINLLTINML